MYAGGYHICYFTQRICLVVLRTDTDRLSVTDGGEQKLLFHALTLF